MFLSENPVIVNERGLYFIPVCICGLINSLIYKNKKPAYKKVFLITSISLFYLYIIFEINSAIFAICKDVLFINCAIYALLGLIYSYNLSIFSTKKEDIYDILSKVFLFISVAVLVLNEFINNSSKLIPIANIRLAVYPITFLLLNLRHKEFNNDIIKYLMVFLGFLYVHFEANGFANMGILNLCNLPSFNFLPICNTYGLEGTANSSWIISLIWILYGGMVSSRGIFNKKTYLKISGIWICILAVLRIFIFDLAGLDMLFKLIALIILAVILMSISYLYNKNKN